MQEELRRRANDESNAALFAMGSAPVLVDSLKYAEMFYLVDAGEGRWTVLHGLTDEFAGTIMRTTQGLVLRDGASHFWGTFPTVESVLRNLYALA
jgi:hypothetical protein